MGLWCISNYNGDDDFFPRSSAKILRNSTNNGIGSFNDFSRLAYYFLYPDDFISSDHRSSLKIRKARKRLTNINNYDENGEVYWTQFWEEKWMG